MSLFYRIKVPLFEWKEQRWVARSHPTFKTLDKELLKGPNPYREARIFPYGETPLKGLYAIGQAARLTPDDSFIDLGCGRGRGVFFLSHIFGCKGIGVDLTPSFIARARELQKAHGVKNVSFVYQDFLNTGFRAATFVYLYGTTYSDACLEALEEKFKELPEGSRVATVSAPLKKMEVRHEIEVRFPWGKGTVYIHTKCCSKR